MRTLKFAERPLYLRNQIAVDVLRVDLHADISTIPDEPGIVFIQHIDRHQFFDTVTRRLKLWRKAGLYDALWRKGWGIGDVIVYFLPCVHEEISTYRAELKEYFQYSLHYIGRQSRKRNPRHSTGSYATKANARRRSVKVFGNFFESIIEAAVYVPAAPTTIKKYNTL